MSDGNTVEPYLTQVFIDSKFINYNYTHAEIWNCDKIVIITFAI